MSVEAAGARPSRGWCNAAAGEGKLRRVANIGLIVKPNSENGGFLTKRRLIVKLSLHNKPTFDQQKRF